MRRLLSRFRYHLLVFFAVLGPGFITAVVDNDAGGIITYSNAGAYWGTLPLWTLLPITLVLIVTQEMCSRMGAVTGKGLSDLIREEFGLRVTFIVMTLLVLANLTNVMANFAGVAASLEILHVPRYVSVPLAALAVWFLVVKGNYQSVEKIFLFACVFYITYVISGIYAQPNWKEAFVSSFRPALGKELLDQKYIYMLIGMMGTTVAPWMQFYLQAAVVEKGVSAKEYAESRIEVVVGCIMTAVIAFFIIVSCAAAYRGNPTEIVTADQAAKALEPLGRAAELLFTFGLFNASIFAASILPLSTAYSVCEGLGFESGVNRRWREAPIFYTLYTLLIVIGAGVVLFPQLNLVRIILFSQVLNGMLLPIVLIFMVLLINKRDLMGEWGNPRWVNLVAWVAVVFMIGLSLALIRFTIQELL